MNYYFKVLKNYAAFSGRASRSEYWYYFLFNTLISMAFGLLGVITKVPEARLIYAVAVLIPGIAVAVRRMHDVGKSGWYCLIPIYNFVLACTEGDRGENEYGTDPQEEELVA